MLKGAVAEFNSDLSDCEMDGIRYHVNLDCQQLEP